MVERTVKIEDDLEERVEGVKEEVRQDFIDYLKENKDIDDFDTYYQNQGCDCRSHGNRHHLQLCRWC